jgi:hypothetical protein
MQGVFRRVILFARNRLNNKFSLQMEKEKGDEKSKNQIFAGNFCIRFIVQY